MQKEQSYACSGWERFRQAAAPFAATSTTLGAAPVQVDTAAVSVLLTERGSVFWISCTTVHLHLNKAQAVSDGAFTDMFAGKTLHFKHVCGGDFTLPVWGVVTHQPGDGIEFGICVVVVVGLLY